VDMLTGAKRSPAVPDLPTMAEAGLPEFVVESWYGLMVPTGTPDAVIRKAHDATVKTLARADVVEAFAKQSADVVTSTPAEFAAMVGTENARWADVIAKSGARID
jgi:tripartite-type tricarboxylate transporter receptor subunit TctC